VVAELPAGSWQGPIKSGFGWHLVFVDTVIPGRVPAFEEIESDVKTARLGEQKESAWEKAYNEMRAKYTVLIPRPPDDADSATQQYSKVSNMAPDSPGAKAQ
jgi:peptidyl-prolyl cis-trans isomerase C